MNKKGINNESNRILKYNKWVIENKDYIIDKFSEVLTIDDIPEEYINMLYEQKMR